MASPTRRSRNQMSAATTTQLLTAARRTFAAQGYAASAMDAICADAGVTRGALYHHFGGKEGLLLAVVQQIDADIATRIEAEEARHDDPWQGFRASCRLWLELARDPEIQRIYLRDAPAVLGQKMREIDEVATIAEIRDTLATLMHAGRIRSCDPEALARLIKGALVDAALWVAALEDDSALIQALAATDILLDGLEI
jgi:AcrR family transcriptional regulator